jgi:O-methyltransferase
MASVRERWNQFSETRLVKKVLPYTLVGPEAVRNLCALARRIEKESIPGDVIECGVCNGGTAAALARFATRSSLNRVVWLLDSFQGMPLTTIEDASSPYGGSAEAHIGQEKGDPIRVKEVLRRVGADMDRVRIVPGWFQDTFPAVKTSQIALLNIDADWYESVKLCFETFYDRVAPGGFISIDDYGYWPGCKRAVDEFFHARQLPYKLNQVNFTVHWFQKL